MLLEKFNDEYCMKTYHMHKYIVSIFILLLPLSFCLASSAPNDIALFLQEIEASDIPKIKSKFSQFEKEKQDLIVSQEKNSQQKWLLNELKNRHDNTLDISKNPGSHDDRWEYEKCMLKIPHLEGIKLSHIKSVVNVHNALYFFDNNGTTANRKDLMNFSKVCEKSSDELRYSFKIRKRSQKTWRIEDHRGTLVKYRPKELSLSYVLKKSFSPHFFCLLALSHVAMFYSYDTLSLAKKSSIEYEDGILAQENRLLAAQEFVRELKKTCQDNDLTATDHRFQSNMITINKINEIIHLLRGSSYSHPLEYYDDFFTNAIKENKQFYSFKNRWAQSVFLYPVSLIPGILSIARGKGFAYEFYKIITTSPFHWENTRYWEIPLEFLLRSFASTLATHVVSIATLFFLTIIPNCLSLHSLSEYFLSNGVISGIATLTGLMTTLRILYVILDSYRWKTKAIIFKEGKTITECLNPILNNPTIEIKSDFRSSY